MADHASNWTRRCRMGLAVGHVERVCEADRAELGGGGERDVRVGPEGALEPGIGVALARHGGTHVRTPPAPRCVRHPCATTPRISGLSRTFTDWLRTAAGALDPSQ